jgi:chemotaxis protein methyltransferase CheR
MAHHHRFAVQAMVTESRGAPACKRRRKVLDPVKNPLDAEMLAQAIVNTVPEPFLILDESFRVLAASRAFCEVFKVDPADTQDQLLFALGDGQWNIPALRHLLETIIPDRVAMDNFEVEYDFPGIGLRIMLLNARKVVYQTSPAITILLAFRDVTATRTIERDLALLLEQTQALLGEKRVLLQEMQHRVANSLQIIASILLLKARAVSSEETRGHLQDAHQRVMAVATVQQYLHTVEGIEQIELSAYLARLSMGLGDSMVGESQPVAIEVVADDRRVESATAVSLGLIVTELVINALKYAFPDGKADARIRVSYESNGEDWRLIVADNGVGHAAPTSPPKDAGLGTTIVKALAKQLGAQVVLDSSAAGLRTVITRASFNERIPEAP